MLMECSHINLLPQNTAKVISASLDELSFAVPQACITVYWNPVPATVLGLDSWSKL